MGGGPLAPHTPLPFGVDDRVEAVILEDVPAQDPRPEGTLGVQVGCVEDHHGSHEFHGERIYEARSLQGSRAKVTLEATTANPRRSGAPAAYGRRSR